MIEVKTTLTQYELNTSAAAAGKVRRLKPSKESFVASQTDGNSAERRARCPYVLFAYQTNLSADGWAKKEYERINLAVTGAAVYIDVLDSMAALYRGVICPQVAVELLNDQMKCFWTSICRLSTFLTEGAGADL